MDFATYLQTCADEINQEIESFLQEWNSEVGQLSTNLLPLTNTLIENCAGGKRLRGTLVKLGYEIASVSPRNDDILKVAAAIEIFQTSILAHDDIIDQSPLRRGKPTIYKQLGGDHYAISQTIALADIGFFLAVKLISEADFEDGYKNKAIQAFAKTVINTGLGEVLDVELPHLQGDRVEEDVITIHKLKTSYYTIIDPLQLGIILAGGSKELLDKVAEFGENLGIAFQLQDDILGVFGDESVLGKSVTSDIAEGKNTFLITQALKNANQDQKKILDRYYGHGNVGEDGLEAVRKVFIDTGSLDYSRQEAQKYVKMAKKIIPDITKDTRLSSLLEQMAEYLVNRTK